MNGWLFALLIIALLIPVAVLAMWLAFNASLAKRFGPSVFEHTPKIFTFRPIDWLWLRLLVATIKNSSADRPVDQGGPTASK